MARGCKGDGKCISGLRVEPCNEWLARSHDELYKLYKIYKGLRTLGNNGIS